MRAVVKLTDVKANIQETIELVAVDASGQVVDGVSISPEKVEYTQKVAESGGYRNVVVKVVTAGQVPSGYKLTSLSVFPPTVTVFATDPLLVDALPGYVETLPIDLTGKTSDFEQRITLNLPFSVQAIEAEQVTVRLALLQLRAV